MITEQGSSISGTNSTAPELFKSELFKKEIAAYKEKIDQKLAGPEAFSLLSKLSAYPFMRSYASAYLDYCRGGKRIRAFLAAVGYGLCRNAEIDDSIITPSLAFELFQSGILIHDDIIDNSPLRRGKPSMHVTLGDGETGRSKAICVGDIGMILASDIILGSDFPEAIKTRALSLFNKVMAFTLAGELKDVELSDAEAYTQGEILDMYVLKTAWYTFTGPLLFGATLAGAGEDMMRALEQFGSDAGIAFQIKDDIIGIFGNEEVIGKTNLSDVCEGKRTILTCHFLKTASEPQLQEFRQVYGKKDANADDLLKVRTLLENAGSRRYAEDIMLRHLEKARASVHAMPVDEHYRMLLTGMIEYLGNRLY